MTTNETATRTTGFGNLLCIRCGQEATVRLDLDDCNNFTCCECNENFSVEDVQAHLTTWQRVLTWVKTCPGKEE